MSVSRIDPPIRQRDVAEMFARIARRYDRMNTLMTLGRHRAWKQELAELTAQGLSGRALDVGTGTGDVAFLLLRHTGIRQVVGVDLLPQMIRLAQAKVRRQGLARRAAMLVGDALALPFPDASFICATTSFSLRNFPDPKQALEELARVTQPGGRVTTLDLLPMPPGVRAALVGMYFRNMVPMMGQVFGKDKTAYTYLPHSVERFLDADCLAGIFADVGLIDVGYRRLGFGAVALHWGAKPT